MKNPHEAQQVKLLNRIVGSVGRLQKAMNQLNNQLEDLKPYQEDLQDVSSVWTQYAANVKLYNNGSITSNVFEN